MRWLAVASLVLAAALVPACDSGEFVPACDEYHRVALTFDFEGFDEHVGQELHLRVTGTRNWKPPDPGPYEEISRAEVTIPGGAFSFHQKAAATSCMSLHVDLFVDANGNGLYDAPPADHAWRLYAFVWEGEITRTIALAYNLDSDSCEFDLSGHLGFCDYLDIEWPG